MNEYIPTHLISSNSGWHSGWFYLHNDEGHLPCFTDQVIDCARWNWRDGAAAEDRARLGSLLDALQVLRVCGLTAGAVDAAFYSQRVLPLV